MVTVKAEIANNDDDRVLIVSKDPEYDSTEQIWLQVWEGSDETSRKIVSEFVVTKGDLMETLNEISVVPA